MYVKSVRVTSLCVGDQILFGAGYVWRTKRVIAVNPVRDEDTVQLVVFDIFKTHRLELLEFDVKDDLTMVANDD